jgi:DNA-binding NarL/FixJ family response regulator
MMSLAEKTVPRYPIRLLLVDDHPVVRAGLNSMLRKQTELSILGSLHSGRQALEFLANEPADVILLDLRMPNMDGINTMRALRKLPSPPKVVVLSHFESEEEIFRAIEEGAMAYLFKGTSRSSPPLRPCTPEVSIFRSESRISCWRASSAAISARMR